VDLHVESMPDDPSLQAFLYGPLVLAAYSGDVNGRFRRDVNNVGT
jgi:hypothetical protein